VLQVHNFTPFQTERGVLVDPAANQIWVVAIKATYVIAEDGAVKRADEQEPVAVAPAYFGEPGLSSLRREQELTFAHPGTDVTVNAAAHAAGGRPVTSMNVAVEVAGMRKAVTVVGDRVWRVGALGARKSSPEPFTRVPIVYERAFGGTIPDDPTAIDPRNPVGTGFARSDLDLHERPLPNVEEFQRPIDSWKDRPAPAGFGAVGPNWAPRSELAGTFDEAWKKTHAPYWPSDHDVLFHRSASPGLWSEKPLRGHERVATTGLTPSGSLSFRLPHESFVIETHFAGQRIVHPPQLDRVIVDLDERRLIMVWCARLPCGARARQVEFTRVDLKARIV
jgi:hypothetical protein